MPSLMPKATERTMFAVLRATPGSVVSSSMVCGTVLLNFSRSNVAVLWMLFALLLKKFTERMSCASFSGGVSAWAWTVRYFLNRPSVTLFTSTSVVWAESMVATSSSRGLKNRRTVRGVFVYTFFSRLMISRTFSLFFMPPPGLIIRIVKYSLANVLNILFSQHVVQKELPSLVQARQPRIAGAVDAPPKKLMTPRTPKQHGRRESAAGSSPRRFEY